MPEDRRYRLGRFELVIPADHKLDAYQTRFRLYDWILGEIARLVVEKYPDATVIDIGANVGDSAAAICRHRDIPVLCIEGSPVFLAYLQENLRRLPACIDVAECLVWTEDGTASSDRLKTANGTASFVPPDGGGGTPGALVFRPLANILEDHPRFRAPRLIKSDTDGSDFDILLASEAVYRGHLPVLYFEYDPTFRKDGHTKAIALIEALIRVGYASFMVYDNFGHYIDRIDTEIAARFADLDRYLMSHLFYGRQIYYLDVCAVSGTDRDIGEKLVAYHRRQIDQRMARAGWQT